MGLAPGIHFTNSSAETVYLTRVLLYPFLYFVMAFLSYSPRGLWRHCRGRSLEEIITDLLSKKITEENEQKSTSHSAELFVDRIREHRLFGLKYFLVVFWNLLQLSIQLIVLVYLVARGNYWFAIDAFRFVSEDYNDYPWDLAVVFPQISKCSMYLFSRGGSIDSFHGICNLHYMKLHMILMATYFFVLSFLIILETLHVLYLMMCILSSRIRAREVRQMLMEEPDSDAHLLIAKINFGSFVIAKFLIKNLGPSKAEEILAEAYIAYQSQEFETFHSNRLV